MSELPEGIKRHRAGFQVTVTEGGVRRRKTVYTLQEAVEYRTLIRAETVLENARGKSKTLQDCYNQAMVEKWSRAKNPKSQRSTLINANIVLTFFGAETLVKAITRSDITAFDEYLRRDRGCSDSTINHYHAPLSTMLTIALEHGWIDRKPVIKHFRPAPGRVRWLSEHEESVILGLFQAWGAQDAWDAIAVLIDTGMRPSELWEAGPDVCNFSWVNPRTGETGGMIHIWFNKNDVPRSLPLTQRAYDVLKRRAAKGEAFFPEYKTHHKWDYGNKWLERMWDRAKLLGGINDATLVPYCCRHTCATRLLQRGMELPELQKWLGHKDIKMTMRYAHLSPTALAMGAKLLEQKEVPREIPGIGGVAGIDSL
jgi:integrase